MSYSDASKVWFNRGQMIDAIHEEHMHKMNLDSDLKHKELDLKAQLDQARLKGEMEAKMEEIHNKTKVINNEHEQAMQRINNEDKRNQREYEFKNKKENNEHEERLKKLKIDEEEKRREADLKMTKENHEHEVNLLNAREENLLKQKN